MTLFFLQPSTGCMHLAQPGGESERQARLAGCVLVPDDDLRRVTHMTRAERREWAAAEKVKT